MSYQEYLAKRRQDPEYRRVEKRLKPILDFADNIFNLRMSIQELLTRLKLAWRVLLGKAVMYRIKAVGMFELDVSQGAHIVECEFKPASWQMEMEETKGDGHILC